MMSQGRNDLLSPDWLRQSRDHYSNARARDHVLSVIVDASAYPDKVAEVRALRAQLPCRDWHHEKTDGGITLGCSMSTCCRQVTMINPTERTSYARWGGHGNPRESNSYVLWFGAYGWTRLHVYARSLDEALEECAAWLAEHAPGHITTIGDETYQDLMSEACQEAGIPWPYEAGDHDYASAEDNAMVDQTRTESGWINEEWGIALENPTTEDLYRYVRGL